MTAIIEKLKRKPKLSSEMHGRWGDVSISYPLEGSWSQCQPGPSSTIPVRTAEQSRRHGSLDSSQSSSSSRIPAVLRSGDRTPSLDSAMAIPTGHYDAKLRGRSMRQPQPQYTNSHRHWDGEDSDCSDDEDVPPMVSPRGYPASTSRVAVAGELDPYERASKSPPLSVTSRMRRCSQQSATTAEPTPCLPMTASSKHSSFTSTVPSMPSEEPRLVYATNHDKKPQPLRPKPREPEKVQELVPSYDELYG